MTVLHCIVWFGLVALAAVCTGIAAVTGWMLFREWKSDGVGSANDPGYELTTMVFAMGGFAFSVVTGLVVTVIAIDWRPCI